MDGATLVAHRDAWGTEPTPSRTALTRLTAEESALYDALGGDQFGQSVRLVQELIRWDWAVSRTAAGRTPSNHVGSARGRRRRVNFSSPDLEKWQGTAPLQPSSWHPLVPFAAFAADVPIDGRAIAEVDH